MVAPTIKLNNGQEMPVLGLGTWLSKDNKVKEAVKHAISRGYRLIDTAFYYQNEKEVGDGIKQKIADGSVKRDDIFLTTKLWSTHHEPSKVEYACRKSLENLGFDFIDLYLMHFPAGFHYVDDKVLLPKKDGSDKVIYNDVDYVDTWREMEKLVKKGLVRSIGISNFNSDQIDRLLKMCEIRPVTNQVECHVEFNQKKLIEFCTKRGIVLTAHTPLGRHSVAEKTPKFLYDDRVRTIGAKYRKTSAQIALKYLIQIGTVPIPKSLTGWEIDENIDIFDFELSAEDMKILDTFNTGVRLVQFYYADKTHKYYPFNIEY